MKSEIPLPNPIILAVSLLVLGSVDVFSQVVCTLGGFLWRRDFLCEKSGPYHHENLRATELGGGLSVDFCS